MAVKKQNLPAVKILTGILAEQYLIRDLSGLTPLHVAVTLSNADITGLIATAGPSEALTFEDGVGSTPLEIATYRAFVEKLGSATSTNTLGVDISLKWHTTPFARAQEKELPRFKAALDTLSAEGRLSKGTKLWKELTSFYTHLEEKIAAMNRLEHIDTEKDECFKGAVDRSQTLRVLKDAIDARPGFRRLVHLADVHISVNKDLESYAGVLQVGAKDDGDEEPIEEAPRPVQTAEYEYPFNYNWLASCAIRV